MKLHFTPEWLRSHIENDPDIESDAGFPLLGAEPLKQFVGLTSPKPLTEAGVAAPERKMVVLYQLVRQLRRRDGLSVAQLADRIRVEIDEVTTIETHPDYTPKPRTVHQLAEYMGVPAKAIEQLTADAQAQNDNLTEAASQFAASSDDLSKLSRAEKRGLNDFVKVLASIDKST